MTLRSFLLLWCVLGGFVSPVLAGDVVLLHSEARPDGWTRGVARVLCPAEAADCRVTELFLGPASRGDDFFEDLYERFCPDWCGVSPAAVIADGESAFAFVRKYREDLFGVAPVVYLGMPRPEENLVSQCGVCSGVPLTLDVRATIDLLFRLRPETEIVVGIMDGSPASMRLKLRVEAAMEPYQGRAQVVFPGHEPGDGNGLDMAGLATVASSVPRSGAVIFLGFLQDKTGGEVDEAQGVRLLAERSVAPVYVLTDRWMGTGVLGGVLACAEDQGRGAACLAIRLANNPLQSLPPVSQSARMVIDLTVLTRFGVPADRLPADALKINPPPHPDETFGIVPIRVGVLFVGLVVLVWLLFRRLRQ